MQQVPKKMVTPPSIFSPRNLNRDHDFSQSRRYRFSSKTDDTEILSPLNISSNSRMSDEYNIEREVKRKENRQIIYHDPNVYRLQEEKINKVRVEPKQEPIKQIHKPNNPPKSRVTPLDAILPAFEVGTPSLYSSSLSSSKDGNKTYSKVPTNKYRKVHESSSRNNLEIPAEKVETPKIKVINEETGKPNLIIPNYSLMTNDEQNKYRALFVNLFATMSDKYPYVKIIQPAFHVDTLESIHKRALESIRQIGIYQIALRIKVYFIIVLSVIEFLVINYSNFKYLQGLTDAIMKNIHFHNDIILRVAEYLHDQKKEEPSVAYSILTSFGGELVTLIVTNYIGSKNPILKLAAEQIRELITGFIFKTDVVEATPNNTLIPEVPSGTNWSELLKHVSSISQIILGKSFSMGSLFGLGGGSTNNGEGNATAEKTEEEKKKNREEKKARVKKVSSVY